MQILNLEALPLPLCTIHILNSLTLVMYSNCVWNIFIRECVNHFTLNISRTGINVKDLHFRLVFQFLNEYYWRNRNNATFVWFCHSLYNNVVSLRHEHWGVETSSDFYGFYLYDNAAVHCSLLVKIFIFEVWRFISTRTPQMKSKPFALIQTI